MRGWLLPTLVGFVIAGLIGASVLSGVLFAQLEAADRRVAALESEVLDLQAELEDAATPAPPQPPAPPTATPAPAPDDLLGDRPLAGVSGEECIFGGDAPDLGDLLGDDDAPDEPAALVDHIAEEVEVLRGLAFEEPVEVEFLTQPQAAERIRRLIAEDYPPERAAADSALLAALGVVTPGTDMVALQQELIAGQVAGFYVHDSEELVVVQPEGDGVPPTSRITIAHELLHALTDQRLGIPNTADEEPELDEDTALASLAVTEGDASLIESLWAIANLSLAEQLALADDPSIAAAEAQLEDMPHFLRRALLFPYLTGLDFTCAVLLSGGWDAVDVMYDAPPESTAQILFPDRYRADVRPVAPPQLSAPDGFEELHSDTFGAAYLLWLFEAPGGDPDAALPDPLDAASAWAGGTFTAWQDGDDHAVGISLVQGGDGADLCASLTDWYAATYPDAATTVDGAATTFEAERQDAVIACDGDTVAFTAAPALQVARAIIP